MGRGGGHRSRGCGWGKGEEQVAGSREVGGEDEAYVRMFLIDVLICGIDTFILVLPVLLYVLPIIFTMKVICNHQCQFRVSLPCKFLLIISLLFEIRDD